MPYSSTVSTGDVILATHYNNVRKDALGLVDVTGGTGGVAQYDALYMPDTGGDAGEVLKAKADSWTTARVRGIAFEAIGDGSTGGMQTHGEITNGGWSFTAGQDVYLSDASAGALIQDTSSIGDTNILVKVGWAKDATTLVIDIGTPSEYIG